MRPLTVAAPLAADMNVTPFMDVMLVLLIIFMVVTPLLQSDRDLVLAMSRTFAHQPSDQEPTIAIDRAGGLQLNGRRISRPELELVLHDIGANPAPRLVWIAADRRLAFREVEAILEAAGAAGVRGAGLVTQRLSDPVGPE
jgi:biopolymer transport protein ExbD